MELAYAYVRWSPRPTKQQIKVRKQIHRILDLMDFPERLRHDFRWLQLNLWRREHNKRHRLYRPLMILFQLS